MRISTFLHIIIEFPEKVSQKGMIKDGLSDHYQIHYTRKINEINTGFHEHVVDIFEDVLCKLNLNPNDEQYS